MRSALPLLLLALLLSLNVMSLSGCPQAQEPSATAPSAAEPAPAPGKDIAGGPVTLTFAAYTVPKEAYQKSVIPAFKKYWKDKTGQDVEFVESYEASGAQSRAICSGLEADVACLSLAADIDRIKDKGLITHDWTSKPHKGMITNSVVALGVRLGNPKGITTDWESIAKPGIEVLCPNPETSGGAQWDVNAIYGGGLKASEKKGKKDEAYAADLLKRVRRNIKVMDKSGRASMTTFEKGIGDVVITYENELLLRNMESKKYEIIIPDATLLIENPVAVVDVNADKHGVREVAEAFVDFLWTTEAQEGFGKYGLRPVDPEVFKQFADKYPTPPQLFTMDYLGGWETVNKVIYGPDGLWTKIGRELTK